MVGDRPSKMDAQTVMLMVMQMWNIRTGQKSKLFYAGIIGFILLRMTMLVDPFQTITF
jgi:hypothetical protein